VPTFKTRVGSRVRGGNLQGLSDEGPQREAETFRDSGWPKLEKSPEVDFLLKKISQRPQEEKMRWNAFFRAPLMRPLQWPCNGSFIVGLLVLNFLSIQWGHYLARGLNGIYTCAPLSATSTSYTEAVI
jgi:hypothetical protein